MRNELRILLSGLTYLITPFIIACIIGGLFTTNVVLVIIITLVLGYILMTTVRNLLEYGPFHKENRMIVNAFIADIQANPHRWKLVDDDVYYEMVESFEPVGLGEVKTKIKLIHVNPYVFDFFNCHRLDTAFDKRFNRG